jgi:tellurite resistance protein TehA-like permease
MDRSAYVFGLFLLLALIGVATWIAVELRWWRRGQQVISRGQFISRMLNAAVVVGVLLMVAAGRFVLRWDNPRAEVTYWIGLLLIVLLIAGFGVGDWRRVMALRDQKQKEMYRELVASLKRDLGRREQKEKEGQDREGRL